MATVHSLVCWGGATGKTVTLSIASPCVMTNTAHGARDGLKVQFSTTGALPTGITAGTTYYLKSTGANTANLYTDAALTSIVNTSGSQSGTHTAKSANMLALVVSSPTKYGPTGIERIYDNANSCNNARIANAIATDDDVVEFCDPFDESRTTQLQVASAGYANTTTWTSLINGARSDAFHFGNPSKGHRTIVTGTNGAISAGAYNVTVDGLQFCRDTTSNSTLGIVTVGAVGMVFRNNIVRGLNTGTGPGINITNTESRTYNNIVLDCKGTTYGGLHFNASNGALCYNNLVTKCDLGLAANNIAGSALIYNNISVGNTQNYGNALVFAATRLRRNIGETTDKATFTVTTSSTTMTLSTAPPFAVNQQITLATTGTLPTVGGVALSSDRSYFVRSVSGANITIGLTYNGAALTFDGAGTGTHTVPFGWESVSGSYVAYIDFTTPGNVFVDWANNDFRPAGTAPKPGSAALNVDYGIDLDGMYAFDMLGNERPAYKNGDPEYWDAGPFEFDYGYTRPTLNYRGLAFTGLIAGSTLKVFETGTTTELFSDTSTATTETWSENSSGSKTVDYTILKDGYVPIRVTGITVTGAETGGIIATPIQQKESRAYQASSGLTYGTTATINTGTKEFAVTVATTIQNFYSFCCEAWRTESALKNVAFPLVENGPNSFQLSGDWVFASGSIPYLSRDGMRTVNSSGTVTGVWAAVLSVGVPSGMQVRYQQQDGSGTTNAANTGNMDQLVKIFEDGAFDYTGHMVLKVQDDGYDQAEFDMVATFGTLEDQFYVAGLSPVANGIGADTITDVTITDHGASPVTWNSKTFSITITDDTGHTGEQILQYVRGLNNFNYHDLVQTNGTEFKTVRGKIYGDTGATLKGVRVVQADGTTSHADFNLHTADDGTTYVPPLPPAAAEATILADSRVQLFNVTTDTEIDNDFITGTSYSYVITTEASLGDVLRLRVCKLGREEAEAFAIWSASGAAFLITQPENTIYTAWGIDGSTVTEFSLDGPNLQIDANDVDGATTKTRLGAFYNYALTTEIGIRDFFGAVTFLSTAAIRVNTDVTDLYIDNINPTTALRFTDLDVRLYKSDGTTIIAPTSYSIHNDYSGVPDVVETGVSGLTTAESNQLFGLPDSGAIVSALSAAEIPVNMVKVKGQTISGSGSEADPWGRDG